MLYDVMAKKRRSKPEAVPLSIHTFVIRPPEWNDQKAALQYLEGGFADHLHAIHDLMVAGVYVPPDLLEDLAVIAEDLTEFIRKPRPLVLTDDSSEYVEQLGRSINELRRKVHNDGGFETTEGLSAQLFPTTYDLLASALSHASTSLCEEIRQEVPDAD